MSKAHQRDSISYCDGQAAVQPCSGEWSVRCVHTLPGRVNFLETGDVIIYQIYFLMYFFQESEVTFLEEKLILDESMLLSSLGGTIGIFLGWSLLDLTDVLLRVMERFFERGPAINS